MSDMRSGDHRGGTEGIAPVIDPRRADVNYEGFPTFEEWSKTAVDPERWNKYAARLSDHGELTSEQLRQAQEVAKRAAAVDTGAIEGLYPVDRGFTFTVATQAAMWEAAVNEKGPGVRALIESQLEAYDYVLDLATQATPITEAWIRELHAKICAGQEYFPVQTETGPQRHKLPHGEYKQLPNHVQRPDGKIHAYAPVDLTPAEMYRLVSELRSEAFLAAHPVLQASYAHYALTGIHPFADGNGRVARALASVFTYRSNFIPLLVLADTRAEYLSALDAADSGNFQPFVDFVRERGIDSIQLVEQSLSTAKSPKASETVSALRRLYTTRGGFAQREVDEAGYSLFEAFVQEVQQQAQDHTVEGVVTFEVGESGGPAGRPPEVVTEPRPTHRHPVTAGVPSLRIEAYSAPPAQAHAHFSFSLEVPRDADSNDDLIIQQVFSTFRENTKGEAFTARVAECSPTLSNAVQMRINIYVRRVLGEILQDLSIRATTMLRGSGD